METPNSVVQFCKLAKIAEGYMATFWEAARVAKTWSQTEGNRIEKAVSFIDQMFWSKSGSSISGEEFCHALRGQLNTIHLTLVFLVKKRTGDALALQTRVSEAISGFSVAVAEYRKNFLPTLQTTNSVVQ
jgi:hypothetical protein